MSKKFFYLLMFTFSLSLLTACSDDDDDDNNVKDHAVEAAGTYFGDLVVNIGGEDAPSVQKGIKLSKVNVNQTKLELNDFSLPTPGGMIPVGDIIVNDVTVSKTSDIIHIEEKTATVTLNLQGVEIQPDVTVSGKIVGNFLTLAIKVVNTGVGDVNVTFGGSKVNKTN